MNELIADAIGCILAIGCTLQIIVYQRRWMIRQALPAVPKFAVPLPDGDDFQVSGDDTIGLV